MIRNVSADCRREGHDTPPSFSLASVAPIAERNLSELDVDVAYERAGITVTWKTMEQPVRDTPSCTSPL